MTARRVFPWVLASLLLSGAGTTADPLTRRERDYGMSELHATRKQLLDSVAGLSAAQSTYKPASDRWCVQEVVEHLALSEDMFQDMIQNKILKSPAVEGREERAKRDESIGTPIRDRSNKAQAPEQIRPAGKFKDVSSAVAAFKNKRDAIIRYLETTNAPLRAHVAKFGPHPHDLDAYQWYLAMSAHTARHVQQIEEIKASPGFPRK